MTPARTFATLLSLSLALGIISAARLSAQAASTPSAVSARDRALSPAAASAAALPGEHLVWSDEFDSASSPSPANWVFETGDNGWGNHELETYCAAGSDAAPCSIHQPNSFLTRDGVLHLVARSIAGGSKAQYTSARLKTAGLHSFEYGRIEARIRIPGGPGIWPAFWMLGDDIATTPWPASGEIDIMENIGREPGLIHGTLHGTRYPPVGLSGRANLPQHQPFSADFHRYGILWAPGHIQFYVDDPSHPYASFTPASLPPGAAWPFDGRRFFILLNLAVGGDWPGPPTDASRYPAEMLVDYVRVWQRQGADPAK